MIMRAFQSTCRAVAKLASACVFGTSAWATGASKRTLCGEILVQLASKNVLIAKLLQASAYNTDSFPEWLLADCRCLLDNAPVRHDEVNVSALDSILRAGVVLEDPPLRPRHAGTVALVWKGEYKGNKIAIKIARVGADDTLVKSCEEGAVLVQLLHLIPPIRRINFPSLFGVLKPALEAQTDFKLERSMQDRHVEYFRYAENVRIPKPVPELCSSEALCTEWVDMVDVSEARDPVHLAEILVDTILSALLIHRCVHADAHRGNIGLDQDKVCLLDFGLCTHISIQESEALCDLFRHLHQRDFHQAAKTLAMAFTSNPEVLKSNGASERLENSLRVVAVERERLTIAEAAVIGKEMGNAGLVATPNWGMIILALCASDGILRCHTGPGGRQPVLKLAMEKCQQLRDCAL